MVGLWALLPLLVAPVAAVQHSFSRRTRLAPEEDLDMDNASAPFQGNATTPWVPDKWPPDPNLTDARYSAFIDKWPMTRGLGQFPFLFDWNYKRSGDAMHKNGTWKADPKTVFIKGRPDTIESLFEDLKVCCDTGRTDRYAYLSSDYRLSRVPQEQLDLFQHFFQGGVFWQARDKDVPGFKTAPVGLNEMYFRLSYSLAEKAIASADVASKPKQALAAWGYLRPLNGIPSRRALKAWLQTTDAGEAGVEHRMIEWNQYWDELAKYRFLLAPNGGGILSPKTDEALLLLTVPIMVRDAELNGKTTFDDWVQLGWPIVVLDSWEEITAARLDEWWAKLSPRLKSFRDNCLTSQGLYRVVTGQVSYCQ
mmetsp:Transcript_81744/g.213242  ORF Transcript_81744/g.213242 Transcript_81744/m.213242 type:complete len:365 (+) Transcript_81744:84-1178(+)